MTVRPKIRIAEAGDLSTLLMVLSQLSQRTTEDVVGPPDRSHLASVWAEILADERRTLFVAVIDDVVVGTADMVVVTNLTHGARPVASSRTSWSTRSIAAPASGEH
jgi:hypothetical protein